VAAVLDGNSSDAALGKDLKVETDNQITIVLVHVFPIDESVSCPDRREVTEKH
jgi:hypothetical protein